jgi:hypothetical protein
MSHSGGSHRLVQPRARRPRLRIALRIAACVLGVVLLSLVATASSLADSVVVTPTSVTLANASGSTLLAGSSISGYSNSSEQLLVSVSTTIGTLSMSQTSGLTLSYGYSTFSGSGFSFTGTQASVQAGLATITLTDSGTIGTASVAVTVTANQSGIAYLPATGHYYEFVPATNITWTSAASAAQSLSFAGQSGYLASIGNATVNNFIGSNIPGGAQNVWAGGMSTEYPSGYGGNSGITRVWSWQFGPLAGTIFTECSNVSGTCTHTNDTGDYYSWNGGEPNNSGYSSSSPGSGENYVEINYSGTGNWNDIPNSTSIAGYVVEFGDRSTGGNFTGVYSATANVALATAPGAPTGVSAAGASSSGGQAVVSWTAPSSNGSPVTGYTVTASGGGSQSCATSGATSCTVTGLANATSYTFSVTATDGVGTSAAGTSSSTTVSGPPGVPTGLNANAGPAQAMVSWAASSGNGLTISVYTVTASPGGRSCTWSSGTTRCTVTGLTNGTPYTFTVTATNANGASAASSPSNSVTPLDVPSAPQSISVDGVSTPGGQAAVAWAAPTSDGGTAIISYTATASGGGGQTCTTTGATSCTLSGLTDGTVYSFAVTANNTQGAGAVGWAAATVILALPTAPVITSPTNSQYTNNEPTFSGTSDPNDTITLYINGSAQLTAHADGSGHWSVTAPSAWGDGTYAFEAYAGDTYGNWGPFSSQEQLTIDTTVPTDTSSCGAPNGQNGYFVTDPTCTVQGADPASGVDHVAYQLDGGSVVTTMSGTATATVSIISDGTHTLKTELFSGAGLNSGWRTQTIKILTSGPSAPTVTAPVNGSVSTDVSPTVAVTGAPGDSAMIEVDGVSYGPLTLDSSGDGQIQIPGPLSPGQHTVSARQSDVPGNVSLWSSASIWTVKTSTSVRLSGPTAGPTNVRTPTVTYTSQPGDQFNITIAGRRVAAGTVPADGHGTLRLPVALADGAHTIKISVTDDAGNRASDSIVVTVDTHAPGIPRIVDAPAALTAATSGTFTFSDDQSGVSYECSLDHGAWATCPSTDTLPWLASGPHKLLVRAIDQAGNASPSATYTWTVKMLPPSAAIDYRSGDGSKAAGATVHVSGNGFAPDSSVVLIMHSAPVQIGEVTTDASGSFDGTAELPRHVPAGVHHIAVTGANTAGDAIDEDFYFQVDSHGVTTHASAVASARAPNWSYTTATSAAPGAGVTGPQSGGDSSTSGNSPRTGHGSSATSGSSAATDGSSSGSSATSAASTSARSDARTSHDSTGSGRGTPTARVGGSASSATGSASASNRSTTAANANTAAGPGATGHRAHTVTNTVGPRWKTVAGHRYPSYDPTAAGNAQQSIGTAIAFFTLLGIVGLGAGIAGTRGVTDDAGTLRSAAAGNADAAVAGSAESDAAAGGAILAKSDADRAEESRSSGHHKHSGGSLASAKVQHVTFRHEATAPGDKGHTWVTPLVDRLDAISVGLPARLNAFSPLAARLTNDGAYARAMFGTSALIVPTIGVILGLAAGISTGAAAIPPALGLLAAIIVLATVDALAGFLAAVAFTLVIAVGGGIDSASALRTVLGIDVIFFASTLAASSARPLRRAPPKTAAEWFDRLSDFVVGALIGMWMITQMVSSLSAISGAKFPITSDAGRLALIFGAAMTLRYLMESLAAHLFPARLAKVAPPKLGSPSSKQQILSAAFKTAIYVFFTYAYLGDIWELYVGAGLFFIPSVMASYQTKLPNMTAAVRWMPAGVIKVVLMLIVGKVCATLLNDHVASSTDFVELGFVLLGLPSLMLGTIGFFARDGDTFGLNWGSRFGGIGVVALGVLVIQGVVVIH